MATPDILITPSKGLIEFTGSNTGTISLRVAESGDLHFEGDQGSLLSISDDLSDSLFSIGDPAGMPVFEVFSDDTIRAYHLNEPKFEIDPENQQIRLRDNTYVSGDLYVSGAIVTSDGTSPDHISGLSGYFGKVGIGTSTWDGPNTTLLQVDGDIRLGDGDHRNIIGPTNATLGIYSNPNDSNEGIKFSTDGGSTIEMFLEDGGNVGIGNDLDPTSRLHVNSASSDFTLRLSSAASRAGMVIDHPSTTDIMGSALVLASDNTYRLGTASYYHVSMTQAGGTELFGNGSPKMIINPNGEIIMSSAAGFDNSTSNLGAQLTVSGDASITGELKAAGPIIATSTSRVQADVLNNGANSANIIYRSANFTIVGNHASGIVIQDDGSIGIGTAAPKYPFHWQSGTYRNVIFDKRVSPATASSTYTPCINIGRNDATSYLAIAYDSAGTEHAYITRNYVNARLMFMGGSNGGDHHMHIDKQGKVYVGSLVTSMSAQINEALFTVSGDASISGELKVDSQIISTSTVDCTSLGVTTAIVHDGDSDTKITFDADRIKLIGGGVELIDAREAGTDYVAIGGVDDDPDVNLLVGSAAAGIDYVLEVDAGSSTVGINCDPLDAKGSALVVSGDVSVTGSLRTSDYVQTDRVYFTSWSSSLITNDSSILGLYGDAGISIRTYDGGWKERVGISDGGDVAIYGPNLTVSGDTSITGFTQTKTIYANTTKTNTLLAGSVVGTATHNIIGSDGYWGIRTANGGDRLGAFDLDVYNGGSIKTAFTIANSGNVGIGNTEPSVDLHIGSAFSDPANDLSNPALAIKQAGLSAEQGIYLERGGERKGYYIGIAGVDGLHFQRNFAGTKDDVMCLTRAGDIGIGTANPDSLLHINTSSTSAGTDNFALRLQNPNTAADARVGIAFSTNAETSTNWDGAVIQATNNGIDGKGHITFGSVENNSFTENLRITSSGFVGIGTANPQYVLDVTGTATSHVARFKGTSQSTTNVIIGDDTSTDVAVATLQIRAANDDGAGYDAAKIIIDGYEGRAKGIYFEDQDYSNMFFAGVPYQGYMHTYQIGYGAGSATAAVGVGAILTARYDANVSTDGANGRVLIGGDNRGEWRGSVLTVSGEASISGVVNTQYAGGALNGLRVKGTANRAKIVVSDNDTSAYMIAEDALASFGRQDHLDPANINISNGGNVGMGTIDPKSTLHVDFTQNGEAIDKGLTIHNADGGTNDIAPIYFGVHGHSDRRQKAAIGLKRLGSYGRGSLHFAVDSNDDDASVSFANDTKMVIDKDGNVGIGTTTPHAKFTVNGEASISGELRIDRYISHGGDTDTYFDFLDDRVKLLAGGVEMIDMREAGTNYVMIGGGDSDDVNFICKSQQPGIDFVLEVDAGSSTVGINCDPLDAKGSALAVSGDASITGALVVGENATDAAITLLRSNDAPVIAWNSARDTREGYIQCTTSYMYIVNNNASDIRLFTNNTTNFNLDNAGTITSARRGNVGAYNMRWGQVFANSGSFGTDTVHQHGASGVLHVDNNGTGLIVANASVTGNVLEVFGSQGNLLTVTDDLSDSLFSVGDAAGMPVFEVFSDDTVKAYHMNQAKFEINPENRQIRLRDHVYVSGDLKISGSALGGGTSEIALGVSGAIRGTKIALNDGVDGDINIKSSDNNYNVVQIKNTDGEAMFNIRQSAKDCLMRGYADGGVQKWQIHADGTSYFDGGNVGIGTANPGSLLEVDGSGQMNNLAIKCTSSYRAANIGEVNNASLAFRISQTRQGQTKALAMGSIGSNNADVGIQAYDSNDDSNEPLAINPFGGNVGIGTASPAVSLHVASATSSNAIVRLEGGSDTNKGTYINFLRGSTDLASFGTYASLVGGTSNDMAFYSSSNDFVYYSSAEKMRIEAGGNVGIGALGGNSEAKLQIDGDVSITGDTRIAGDVGIGAVPVQDLHVGGNGGVTSVDSHGRGFRVQDMNHAHGAIDIVQAGDQAQFISRSNVQGDFAFKSYASASSSLVERMRIDVDGKVGIGMNGLNGSFTPSGLLHVKGTNTAKIILENTDNATSIDIDYYNNANAVQSRIRYDEGPGQFSIQPNVSSSSSQTYFNYAGQVALGTSTTSGRLYILDPTDGGASLSTAIRLGRRNGNHTNEFELKTLHDGSDEVDAIAFFFNDHESLRFNDATAASKAVIDIGSNNLNLDLIRVTSSSAGPNASDYFGGSIRYMGERTGEDNSLSIWMHQDSAEAETEVVSITQRGKVLIGDGTATRAGALLVVSGDASISGQLRTNSSSAGALIVEGGGDNARFGDTSNGVVIAHDSNFGYIQGTDIGGSAYNDLRFRTSSNYALTIDTSDRVGIGTTSPSKNLHIYSTDSVTTTRIQSNPGGNSYAHLDIEGYRASANAGNVGIIVFNNHNGNVDLAQITCYNDSAGHDRGDLIFATRSTVGEGLTTRMEIPAVGPVEFPSGISGHLGTHAYARYGHMETAGGDGGSATADAYTDKEVSHALHKEAIGQTGCAYSSFSSFNSANYIMTLDKGQYYVRWTCPGWNVGYHHTRLRDADVSTTYLVGTTAKNNASSYSTNSDGAGMIYLERETNLKMQHFCTKGAQTYNFGYSIDTDTSVSASDYDDDIYWWIEFWKVSGPEVQP